MNVLTLESLRTVGGCMMVGRKGSSYEGVDEEDSGIYQPCILFNKQSWREVPMQLMQKYYLLTSSVGESLGFV
jgi:hypothetical protein